MVTSESETFFFFAMNVFHKVGIYGNWKNVCARIFQLSVSFHQVRYDEPV